MTKKLSKFVSLSLAFSLTIFMLTLPVKAEVLANTLEPLDFTVVIDCDQDGTPEDILNITGELHILIIETTNDNVAMTKGQFVPRNVTGTGEITGATYRGVGLSTDSGTQVSGYPFEHTFVNNFYMIGQGPAAFRSLMHTTFHVTVDANGNVSVSHDNTFATCPGN